MSRGYNEEYYYNGYRTDNGDIDVEDFIRGLISDSLRVKNLSGRPITSRPTPVERSEQPVVINININLNM